MPPVSNETLLRYCEAVYDALERTAKKQKTGELVWEGKFMQLFASCGISNAHYSKVTTTLREIGSIVHVRRGARGVPSQYTLHQRPTAEALEAAHGLQSSLTNASPHDKLSQRVNVLEGRLEGIDIKTLMAHFDHRLKQVEAKDRK